MKISIQKKDIHIYFGRFIPDVHIECVLVQNYEYERNKGVNYVELLSNKFLLTMFNSTDLNINSFFSTSTMISKTCKLLDIIDIVLLEQLEDYNFINIVYKDEDEFNYHFEVLYV